MAFIDFVKSMAPTGVTPLSIGLPGAAVQAISGKSIEGLLNSLVHSVTGSGLTGQQVAQNEYTAEREDTQFQRLVEDLKKAGLNPAMLFGHGAQPASSPSASPSPNGGSFSNMIELASLASQIENIKADTKFKEAQAIESTSRSSLNSQLEAFNERINPLRVKAQELTNNLSSAQEKKIYSELGEIEAHIGLLIKQAATEDERKALVISQRLAEDAKAYQIYELIPYQIELSKAQSVASRAAAALSAVNAAYQNKLLNSDYLENMFSEMSARARSADARAQMDEIKASIRNGTFGVRELGDNVIADTIEFIDGVGSQMLAGFVNFVDNLNPFASAFK